MMQKILYLLSIKRRESEEGKFHTMLSIVSDGKETERKKKLVIIAHGYALLKIFYDFFSIRNVFLLIRRRRRGQGFLLACYSSHNYDSLPPWPFHSLAIRHLLCNEIVNFLYPPSHSNPCPASFDN